MKLLSVMDVGNYITGDSSKHSDKSACNARKNIPAIYAKKLLNI